MDLKWDVELRDYQTANPVVEAESVAMHGSVICPTDEQMAEVARLRGVSMKGFNLQTWGRSRTEKGKAVLVRDPHWIAVRKGTPLHYDPKYPRYSHHLKVRVDEGVTVRGLDKVELSLSRGVYYVLDAHSPHQVCCARGAAPWNVAVSIDADAVLDTEDTIDALLEYAMTAEFLPSGADVK